MSSTHGPRHGTHQSIHCRPFKARIGLLLIILLWPWPHEVDDILLGGEAGPSEVVARRGPAGGPGEALGPGPRGGASEATRAGVAGSAVALCRVQLVLSRTGRTWRELFS